MATAFTGSIILKGDNGKIQADYFTNTDVTLAYCLFSSSGGNNFIDVWNDGYITDLFLNVVALGDTKSLKLYIDQVDTNIRWNQAGSWPTGNNRMFNMNPVRVKKGQRIMVQAI